MRKSLYALSVAGAVIVLSLLTKAEPEGVSLFLSLVAIGAAVAAPFFLSLGHLVIAILVCMVLYLGWSEINSILRSLELAAPRDVSNYILLLGIGLVCVLIIKIFAANQEGKPEKK